MTAPMGEKEAKPRLDLVPFQALASIAMAIQTGTAKYGLNDWRKGYSWLLYAGAAARHLFKWIGGEHKDPDSGLSHLAHAGACIVMLLTWEVTGGGIDDRYKP